MCSTAEACKEVRRLGPVDCGQRQIALAEIDQGFHPLSVAVNRLLPWRVAVALSYRKPSLQSLADSLAPMLDQVASGTVVVAFNFLQDHVGQLVLQRRSQRNADCLGELG